MTAASRPDPAPTASRPERFPLSRRELGVVVAVWIAYAMLTVASRLFDAVGRSSPQIAGMVTVALAEAACWMLLTPPILMLADRLDPEGRRAPQIAWLVLGGIVVSVALGWVGMELRHELLPFQGPPRADRAPLADTLDAVRRARRGRRGGGAGGPPLWFGIVNALLLYLLVVAAGVARAYSRRYQLRRQQAAQREALLHAQLAEARLEALRRQLDPHFLFNTLNAVSALVERDPRGVRRMIARLSELLRHSFEAGDEAEVPLREELALLGRYVEIMQVRFQGRLAVDTEVDDDVLDALVPAMILQPLVENAIKHGVERLTGPGHVVIEAEREGDALVLRVSDDGPGPIDAPNGARRGVGLRNTVARLEQLYGGAQRFTLAPGPLGGTVAEIRLPFHARATAPDPITGGARVA